MPLTLSDAELKEIANKLFLLKSPAPMKLPKPTNTGPDSFTAKFDSIAKDPRFKDMGIGVIDFTEDATLPKIWLHNGDVPWRIGSTSKLAIELAAVQLRDDVRQLQDRVSANDFDELFQMEKLWRLSSRRGTEKQGIQQIAGKDNAPRISGIFDLSKTSADFIGPPTPDADDIFNRLPVVGSSSHHEIRELTWETVGNFDFSELLWLTGAMSSNVAATACASQIGLPYIKAIMRAYGLFDPSLGMYFQLSGALSPRNLIKEPVLVDNAKPDGAKYRPLTNVKRVAKVKDQMFDSSTGKYTDQYSWEPGSAVALTAYMLALMQDKLIDPSSFMLPASDRGKEGCRTIRVNLVGAHSIISPLVEGVSGFVPHASITRQITKIGALGKPDGERSSLICEFAYLETEELDTSSTQPPKEMKFAVVATGISGLIMKGSAGDAQLLSQQLGTNVHIALLKP